MVYTRRTKASDASSSDETGFIHDKMYVAQVSLNRIPSKILKTY